jgi:hypothetical protein
MDTPRPGRPDRARRKRVTNGILAGLLGLLAALSYAIFIGTHLY